MTPMPATLKLTLQDSQRQSAGTLEICMRFSSLVEDLHLDRMQWFRRGMACIVDRQYKFLYHTDKSMEGRHFLGDSGNALELLVLKTMEHTSHATVVGRGHPPERIAGFYKLDNVPWTIIIYGPGEDVLRPILQYRNFFGLSGLLIIGLVIFLIRTHVVKLTENIRLLSDRAGHVAKGEYGDEIRINSRDEMGMLVHNFNAMVEGLKERDFIRNSFGRYVDPDFARQLMKRPDAGQLGGVRKEVVVMMMMTDIRGFTRMAEGLSPGTIHCRKPPWGIPLEMPSGARLKCSRRWFNGFETGKTPGDRRGRSTSVTNDYSTDGEDRSKYYPCIWPDRSVRSLYGLCLACPVGQLAGAGAFRRTFPPGGGIHGESVP